MTPRTASSLPDFSPDGSRCQILINGNSGTAIRLGEAWFAKKHQASSLPTAGYDFHQGDGFQDKLRSLMRGDASVLVGGGDGTIAMAAAIALELDKPFGILPLGTMNMIAKDLGIPPVVEADNIFDLYARARTERIDVGMVGDRPFLCAAALGTIPAASRYREKFRHVPNLLMVPQMAIFLLRQLSAARRRHLHVTVDGRMTRVKTSTLVVSNNLYAPKKSAGHKLAKDTLHGGRLGIYSAAPSSLLDRFRLLLHLEQGDLDTDRSLTHEQATQVEITTRRQREWVAVDGEPVKMTMPLHFTVRHDALRVIVPDRGDG